MYEPRQAGDDVAVVAGKGPEGKGPEEDLTAP